MQKPSGEVVVSAQHISLQEEGTQGCEVSLLQEKGPLLGQWVGVGDSGERVRPCLPPTPF